MVVVYVKKLSPNAKMPVKATKGSTCYDVYALEEVTVGSERTTKVRTGLAFEVPAGYEMEIRPRGGLSSKEGLLLINSPGTLDSDYRGELHILLRCVRPGAVYIVKEGDRVAQFKINEVLSVELRGVGQLSETERGTGGYGSTGR